MSDCLTPVPKETFQKPNRQEPVGSKFDLITLVLKNLHHALTHNNIMVPSISNMYKTDITQKFNSLHIKYVNIAKIHRHKNSM